MKVLFVVRSFTYPLGGIEEVIYQLCEGLKKRNIKTEILTSNTYSTNLKDIKITRVPVIKLSGYYYSRKLIKELRDKKFDILHVHGWGSYIIKSCIEYGHKTKKPVILTPHGFFHKKDFPRVVFKKLYNKLFLHELLSKTSACIAFTSKQKEFLENNGAKEVKIIPNGINPKEFNKKFISFKKNFGIKEKFLLSVGRIEEYKGFQDLILAFSKIHERYSNLKLVIIGKDCGYLTDLINLTKKLKLQNKVIFTGNISRKLLLSAYKEAELYISSSHYESFGITLIEALASETPVISTDTGIASDLPKEFCKIFKIKNTDELAKLIVSSLKENWKEKIKRKSFKFIKENFSWEKIVDTHIKVYKELLN